MKSPFTGGEVILKTETRTAKYRGKEYEYTHVCYMCVVTQEMFTTTEMDEVNTSQIYNQYRVENGIPFPDEICELRRRYGLSARTMSLILGFGENQFRLYENGEMPSVSNGRLLKSMICSSEALLTCAISAREVVPNNVVDKIRKVIAEGNSKDYRAGFVTEWVYSDATRNYRNGYARLSLIKLKNAMLYFIQGMGGVYKTTMNKLLFYTDFAMYRATGMALTGLRYEANAYGPVPLKYYKVYSAFNEISLNTYNNNGYEGEKLESVMSCDESAFTEAEKKILQMVLCKFRHFSATDISNLSHQEEAWKDNIDGHKTIDYKYAFTLKNI